MSPKIQRPVTFPLCKTRPLAVSRAGSCEAGWFRSVIAEHLVAIGDPTFVTMLGCTWIEEVAGTGIQRAMPAGPHERCHTSCRMGAAMHVYSDAGHVFGAGLGAYAQ